MLISCSKIPNKKKSALRKKASKLLSFEFKMSNLILLIIGLAFLILIMECPKYGRAAENTELVEADTSQTKKVENLQEITEKDANLNATRGDKQFWSILPR